MITAFCPKVRKYIYISEYFKNCREAGLGEGGVGGGVPHQYTVEPDSMGRGMDRKGRGPEIIPVLVPLLI
jgi:hypothetical protein